MPPLAQPAAKRVRRPSWKDSRLLVGLLLVASATTLGAWSLRAADERVPMYAARAVLLPGQRLTPDQLLRVDVTLADAGPAYFAAAGPLPAEGYVLREVRAGELLPRSAVGDKAQVSVSPLTLPVEPASAAPLVVGSMVDLHANTPTVGDSDRDFAGPKLILENVAVSRVSTGGGGFGGSSNRTNVQLLVPIRQVSEVIGLVDAGAKITLVPVPGSALRAGS